MRGRDFAFFLVQPAKLPVEVAGQCLSGDRANHEAACRRAGHANMANGDLDGRAGCVPLVCTHRDVPPIGRHGVSHGVSAVLGHGGLGEGAGDGQHGGDGESAMVHGVSFC